MPNRAPNYTENIQLDVARNNMSQGLCLFDANQRVVIANHRYADMYGISPDLLQEETSLQQILEARARAGSLRQRCGQAVGARWLLNAHKEARAAARAVGPP